MDHIYLDNNATTRLCEEALEAMAPYWRDEFGNPSSQHGMGQRARHAVEHAREQVAALIGAKPGEIVFTSGGTEADNLAVLGTMRANPAKSHLVLTAVEHAAIFDLAKRLAQEGLRVSFVAVDESGRLDLGALDAAIGEETAVVCVMHANNETGVIMPVCEAAAIAHGRGVPLHVDAVQSAGRLPIDVNAVSAATMALSSHKMHGPKGAGALYVRAGTRLASVLAGGHQERDLRPGTENVPAIVGFGAAAEVARSRLSEDAARMAALRHEFELRLQSRVDGVHVVAGTEARLCNTSCVAFEGLSAEAILIGLSQRGVCASNGSACASGAMEPSHVLAAMQVPPALAEGAVRFSLSRETTGQELERALNAVCEVVGRIAPGRLRT